MTKVDELKFLKFRDILYDIFIYTALIPHLEKIGIKLSDLLINKNDVIEILFELGYFSKCKLPKDIILKIDYHEHQ